MNPDHLDRDLRQFLRRDEQACPGGAPTGERHPVWSGLVTDLRTSLRMGPGGLDDVRRLRILDAASSLTQPEGVVLFQSAHRRRSGPEGWRVAVAVAAVLLLLTVVAVFLPVPGGIRPELFAQGPSAGEAQPDTRVILYVRLPDAGNRAPQPPAIPGQGGFLPVSRASVAEVVPNPAARAFDEVRDILRGGQMLPAEGSVAVEEMLNYFPYAYPDPGEDERVSLTVHAGPCPWAAERRLVQVGLKGGADTRSAPFEGSLVAQDVRLQVRFNPGAVHAYRLIGYRGAEQGQHAIVPRGADLANGQAITALYEIVPVGAGGDASLADRADWKAAGARESLGSNLLEASVIYRLPGESRQVRREMVVSDNGRELETMPDDFRFAAAVAACGMLLDRAPGLEDYQFSDVLDLAASSMGRDLDGRRSEFLGLVKRAALVAGE